ncbi:response regulator [Bacillus sp. SL00103]
MIRVLVVDESAFYAKNSLVTSKCRARNRSRRNGAKWGRCLKTDQELNPDVVTLDVEMPVLNGTEALKQILAEHDLAVIMVSSQTKQGKDLIIHCLELGAFDFVTKYPRRNISLIYTK